MAYYMNTKFLRITVGVFIILSFFCGTACVKAYGQTQAHGQAQPVEVGASRTELYFPMLKDKTIAVVSNQTGEFAGVHLVDTLLSAGFPIIKVFSPEHGFRGQAEAGKKVDNQIDEKTGLPVISLYGSHRKPTPEDLKGIDLVVFDLQDVGVRFYTYISTLHYVMEACAEQGIPVVVLDRPNPHVGYIDGPVLDTACCRSFIGMHPVPVVYGMTIGEYARMIAGEGWLKTQKPCTLHVIPLQGCTRATAYSFPVWPSPNLRSMKAIYAYPGLCLLEGTPVSMGRGTWQPFECYGFEGCEEGDYTFTPRPIEGLSAHPPLQDKECRGWRVPDSLTLQLPRQLDLQPLLRMYRNYPDKARFFTSFFSKLAGTPRLAEQIGQGASEEEIRASWVKDLKEFEKIRQKYLLYK